MCVIAISPKGKRLPTEKELSDMWKHNPDGSGYMSVRNGRVEIHKGFMCWEDFIRSFRSECFTPENPVVCHFRIATQGGINPSMTHPFPLTAQNIQIMKALDVICDIGVAHNGIIPMTSFFNESTEYSDTALFVNKYMPYIVRSQTDILNPNIKSILLELTNSKLAMMNCNGDIATVGHFFDHDGLLLSNEYHICTYKERWNDNVLPFKGKCKSYGL